MENEKYQDYLKEPYNYEIKLIRDESGIYYYATVEEFDGCQSTGDTFEEVSKNIQEAIKSWIEIKLEEGYKIPLPYIKEN